MYIDNAKPFQHLDISCRFPRKGFAEVETPPCVTREARGSIGDRSLFRSNPGDACVETIVTHYDDVSHLDDATVL
jgi:hypothetical protein